MYDTAITFRTNKKTKAEAQRIFADLGMDISTALNVFLKKVVRTEAIPFEVAINETPNEETANIIREAMEHPETLEGPYANMRDLRKALYD